MKKDSCRRHPTYYINPKYGKCNACRIEDGDLVKCEGCGDNYHDKKFSFCYDCTRPKIAGLDYIDGLSGEEEYLAKEVIQLGQN